MAISLYPVDGPFAIFKVLTGEHPKHGSWLNVAACELSCLTSQCLRDRRIGALTELQSEIAAWSETDAKQRGVDGNSRIENTRVKLKRLYPKIKA